MGTRNSKGFTIIEVSAVIAISGLVLFAVMSGLSLAVERQRFTDAVFTTQSYIQSQYDAVANVVNNRAQTRKCLSADPSSKPRGQGDCVILGRIIVFTAGDTEGTTDDGSPNGDASNPASEDMIKSYVVMSSAVERDEDIDNGIPTLDVINASSPFIQSDPSSNNEYIIPWGARLSNIKIDKTNANVRAIAILRSPQDGSLGIYSVSTDTILDADPFLSPKKDTRSWEKDITGQIAPFSDTYIRACIAQDLNPIIEPIMRAGVFVRSYASKDAVYTEFDQQVADPPDSRGVCI